MPAGVQLTGDVVWIAGSDREIGSATLTAEQGGFSRDEFDLSEGTRIEIRGVDRGMPNGATRAVGMPDAHGQVHPRALFDSWTPAAWFAPELWLGAPLQAASAAAVAPWRVEDLGRVSLAIAGGTAGVEHLRYSRWLARQSGRTQTDVARLSACEVYLDPNTALPVALRFTRYPDANRMIETQVEIRFSDYSPDSRLLVPRHIERWVNGTLQLVVTVTAASLDPATDPSRFAPGAGAWEVAPWEASQ